MACRARRFGLCALLLALTGGVVSWGVFTPAPEVAAQQPATATAAAKAADDEFAKTVVPFLEKYCNGCHNTNDNSGGITLDVFTSAAHAKKDRKTWETVAHVLAEGTMPPKRSKKQPATDERAAVAGYLSGTLLKVNCVGPKDPGRVTMRRLNKAEYNNTIRDLCGVTDFRPADDFPSDDVGYGFDNIGDVLSVQPILVEKYLAAADKVLEKALPDVPPLKSSKNTLRPQNLLVIPREAKFKENNKDKIIFSSDGSAYVEKVNFPATGEYVLRTKVWANKVGKDAAKIALRLNGQDVKTFEVTAPEEKPATVEVKTTVPMGEKRLAVVFVNPFEDTRAKQYRNLGVELLEVEGPFGDFEQPRPESVKMILTAKPASDSAADKRKAAEQILSKFATRAFRRPVKPEETQRLLKLYDLAADRGEKFADAIKLPLKAVLVSPHFLFRVEADPPVAEQARTISEHELATRLSYFLWSSMPDDELTYLANTNQLRKPGVLQAQVVRMLKNWKSQSLVYDFAGQWLMLRSVWGVSPDPAAFPKWDDKLKASAVRETELFFEHVVKNDRKVTEFIDADYTFLNERLATHYGIKGVFGDRFREVKLPDTRRGGVLTHASVLTVTSNPTRTSPVKRGKWVLENILASPPPPPPPDVPELEKTELKGTLRQQMEQHRVNPSCAGCHAKMDPIGFGLENFDATGAWRDVDGQKAKIDASGELPGGQRFDGPADLRKILLGKADQFRRCLAVKLITFALGRGLEYYDKCVLDELVAKLKAGDDKFSALALAIVESEPFQKRKGKRSE